MALDPQARTFLDQLAAMGAPPLTEGTPEEARAAYSMMAIIGGQPEHKAATDDRLIPGPGGTYLSAFIAQIPRRRYRSSSSSTAADS